MSRKKFQPGDIIKNMYSDEYYIILSREPTSNKLIDGKFIIYSFTNCDKLHVMSDGPFMQKMKLAS